MLGNIGRSGVAFALTDADGGFREDSVRSYDADRHTTISAALMAFKEDARLTNLPRRCALAVAGVPRGDTISVTSSRWFISKAGLSAILQRPPLILNDFAAMVWAVSAAGPEEIVRVGTAAPESGPGTFAVLGPGNGLGVAAFIRDEEGRVTVLPTEAGHCELVDDSAEIAPLVAIIKDHNRFCSAETLLSERGLTALRNAIAQEQESPVRAASGADVIRAAESGDPDSLRAVRLFASALWRFAGNIALVYGAWDGIFLTGGIVAALRSTLSSEDSRQSFVVTGPYANLLRKVPCGLLLLEHAALRGAAEAVRHQP